MKRSGFKRPAIERKPQPGYARVERTGVYGGGLEADPKPDEPIQHRVYMGIVKMMPCAHCGKHGPSDFAHRDCGKGMGIKTDCREGFPLCRECHDLLGSSGEIPREERRELELRYGTEARARVMKLGVWPRSLPLWKKTA